MKPGCRRGEAMNTIATTTLLETAALYQSWGWRIFPVDRGKIPRCRWTYWTREPLGRRQTEELFSRPGTAGIGVALGQRSNGLVALDFDVVPACAMWESEFAEIAAELPVSQTFRGKHFFGRVSEAVHGKDFQGGEFKADGRFVILPPSEHESGVCYRWIRTPEPDSQIPTIVPEWFQLAEDPSFRFPPPLTNAVLLHKSVYDICNMGAGVRN